MNLGELQAEAAEALAGAGLSSAALEARRIVAQASGLDGAELVLAQDDPVTERIVAHVDAMVARRRGGEPLQYVLGSWGFRTLDLFVDDRVLIPRPETEGLVEHALAHLQRQGQGRAARPGETSTIAVDLGTGSGAIALSLAAELPTVDVWAVERSTDALDVARANLAGLGRNGGRVRLAHGSWFEPLPDELVGRVDVVVANPPYVAESDPLPDEVARWEPTDALVPGPTGLESIEVIVAGARRWLGPHGALLVEIGETQGAAVVDLATAAGYAEVEVLADLNDRPRFLVART